MLNWLQWAGTACLMSMYIVMSFFSQYHVAQLVFGCMGGLLYLTWTVLVNNRPQMLVNLMGVAITLAGLYKALV
jgi:hypothetical protein